MAAQYVSDVIGDVKFYHGQFNLIVSGTGTGKTEFVRNTLLKRFTEVDPSQILYVTSRSMIRDQQAGLDGIERMGDNETCRNVIRYWNGEDEDLKSIADMGIWIMTYNQFVYELNWWSPVNGELFKNIKIAIFDECHTLVSDKFIKGICSARVWIRERICDNKVLLIGMTATDGILKRSCMAFCNRIRRVNPEYIIRYRAKHLICTDQSRILDLFAEGRLPGKTIMMCRSIQDCEYFHEHIPHSVVLVSMHKECFTDEMNTLRNYIIEHQSLPEDTSIFGHEDVEPIDVLITTSAMREGINIRAESDVRNVICCIADELHVIQFAGRCRFDIENLVVAHRRTQMDNGDKGYLAGERRAYVKYMKDPKDRTWFDTIQHIVQEPFEEIERYKLDNDRFDGFYKWIDENWANGVSTGQKTIGKDDRDGIVQEAYKHRLFGGRKFNYTFRAICLNLESTGKYRIGSKRITGIDGSKKTVKYIERIEGGEQYEQQGA